jgi:hypothetical protein
MEEPIISTTEEGKNEPQLNEDHAHCVFRYLRYVLPSVGMLQS